MCRSSFLICFYAVPFIFHDFHLMICEVKKPEPLKLLANNKKTNKTKKKKKRFFPVHNKTAIVAPPAV